MGSSFGNQYNPGFFNSSEIDWSALQVQEPNALQAQEDMPLDWLFDSSTTDSLSAIQSPATDHSYLLLPDPLLNSDSDAQELYLPDAYPSSLLPPDITDGRQGGGKSQGNSGNKGGGTRKRKADDTLVGKKVGGALKLRKKHMKNTGEIAEEEATEATVEEKDAERLVEEAKAAQEAAIAATKVAEVAAKAAEEADAAQEAAIVATKAAEVAVKAAKEAKVEVAKPGQARRSGRTSTLPGRLQGGYTKPKRGSRAQKST
jgi:hypothetical protein